MPTCVECDERLSEELYEDDYGREGTNYICYNRSCALYGEIQAKSPP